MVNNKKPTIMVCAQYGNLYSKPDNTYYTETKPDLPGFGNKMRKSQQIPFLDFDATSGQYGLSKNSFYDTGRSIVNYCQNKTGWNSDGKDFQINGSLCQLVAALDAQEISPQDVLNAIAAGAQTASQVYNEISRQQDVYLDVSTGKLNSGLELKPNLAVKPNMDFVCNSTLDQVFRVFRYDPESKTHVIDKDGSEQALGRLNHLKGQDKTLLESIRITETDSSHQFVLSLLSGDAATKNPGRLDNVIDFALSTGGQGNGTGYETRKALSVLDSKPIKDPVSLLARTEMQLQNA